VLGSTPSFSKLDNAESLLRVRYEAVAYVTSLVLMLNGGGRSLEDMRSPLPGFGISCCSHRLNPRPWTNSPNSTNPAFAVNISSVASILNGSTIRAEALIALPHFITQ
jgi:hypothetical protein